MTAHLHRSDPTAHVRQHSPSLEAEPEYRVMERRVFLSGSVAVLLLSFAAGAQTPTGGPPRIGWLTSSVVHPHNVEAFREGMRALGYRDVSVEVRAAAGRMDRLSALAAELLALNVEVIVTDGGPAGLAAQPASAAIPLRLRAPAGA